MSCGYVITSDVQPNPVVICRTHSMRETIDHYLKDWYPDANELSIKPIAGADWSDE